MLDADQTPSAQLVVTPVHRPECTFGAGFYRAYFTSGQTDYFQTSQEIADLARLLGNDHIQRVERDGYCLDGLRVGDANTPDVVDAELWLNLPREDAMTLVGLKDEADYARVHAQIEAAVSRRNNRESQTGVHVPIVIKKRGRAVTDIS